MKYILHLPEVGLHWVVQPLRYNAATDRYQPDRNSKLKVDDTANATVGSKHGGVRPNAGRKRQYDEPTAVIRVPVSKKQLVKDFLKTGLMHEVQGNAVIAFPNPQQDLSSQLALTRVKVLTHYQIPVAQELVPAGFPSPAEDHIEDVLDLNEHLIRNKSATFVGRVGSLSMLGAGFEMGDEILIDRSIEARHKDIVIAMIDNGRPHSIAGLWFK